MVQVKVKALSPPPIGGAGEMPETDIHVITSDGLLVPVHSKILAAASPVLENITEKQQKSRSPERRIPILGVPHGAVSAFIKFLYSSKFSEEEMEKYGIHLLVLSHVYLVPQLKQICIMGLARRVKVDNAIDLLQLARLCDAPDLYIKCVKFLSNNFKVVEKTESWNFLQKHDPYLELEILQFIDETESRRKKTRRHREERSLYIELSEAMECLEHICSEGCTSVGPYDMDTSQRKGPCRGFSTCHGLQLLIIHFGTCKKRVNGGCSRCSRMWQLFRLHSSICHRPEECRVPLCQQFKLRAQEDHRRGSVERWGLLVKKVMTAKAMSSLPLPRMKVEKEHESIKMILIKN